MILKFFEDNVDNETRDNQNNRVDLVDGQECSASEEVTEGNYFQQRKRRRTLN